MSVTVLETLSSEDLERMRSMCATIDMLNLAGYQSTMSDDEVKAFYESWYRFCAKMHQKYQLSEAEAEDCKFSPFTGNIYVGSEE